VGVVENVEAAGWCRRQPNPADGRSNLIQLTEALASNVGAAASARELAQLSATLRQLRHHLSTAAHAEMEAGSTTGKSSS
jgi:DNA-binding MarR family transcriptional regulator